MLTECIESILALSLRPQDREIIVIDDGSDLSPINDISNLRDEITYVRQANRGVSVARNLGLSIATGKYIQFVDGDDALLKVAYEHCLDIVRYHDPDVVLFNETDKREADTPFTFEGPVTGSSYMHGNNLHGSACGYIFHRRSLGTLKFTPGIAHAEDEEFTSQLMLRVEKLYYTNADAYFYRKRVNSATSTKTDKASKQDRLNDKLKVILNLQQLSTTINATDRVALRRRIAQLSMDYLFDTIRLTHSHSILKDNIESLRQHGLYPLPDKRYTIKYRLFRSMIDNSFGRRLLLIFAK